MVVRTRPNVRSTLFVHCLSCFVLHYITLYLNKREYSSRQATLTYIILGPNFNLVKPNFITVPKLIKGTSPGNLENC